MEWVSKPQGTFLIGGTQTTVNISHITDGQGFLLENILGTILTVKGMPLSTLNGRLSFRAHRCQVGTLNNRPPV